MSAQQLFFNTMSLLWPQLRWETASCVWIPKNCNPPLNAALLNDGICVMKRNHIIHFNLKWYVNSLYVYIYTYDIFSRIHNLYDIVNAGVHIRMKQVPYMRSTRARRTPFWGGSSETPTVNEPITCNWSNPAILPRRKQVDQALQIVYNEHPPLLADALLKQRMNSKHFHFFNGCTNRCGLNQTGAYYRNDNVVFFVLK